MCGKLEKPGEEISRRIGECISYGSTVGYWPLSSAHLRFYPEFKMEAINSKSELKESVWFCDFLQQVATQNVDSGVHQGNL